MANPKDFYRRLTKLFRSGPSITRRVKNVDTKSMFDNDILRNNIGYRAGAPFGREASPFSVLGAYGMIDRFARYSEFVEMENCLHGDTKIAVPGGYKTIKELADEYGLEETFIVYSYDHSKGQIVPAVAKQARQTTINHAYKVTFDSGKELIGTSDHRLMKRDGTYCTIGDLKVGDAMMPFYRRSVASDRTEGQFNKYQTIYTIGKNDNKYGWVAEHKLLAEFLLGRKLENNEVVHHKNFLAHDNSIENLQVMKEDEHQRLHAKILNGKKWDRESNLEWITEFKKRHSQWMKENSPAERRDVTFERILQWCDENEFSFNGVIRAFDTSQTTILNRLRSKGFQNFSQFALAYDPSWKNAGCDNRGTKNPRYNSTISIGKIYDTYNKGTSQKELATKLGVSITPIKNRLKEAGYSSWEEFTSSYENHKVVKIEYFGVVPLYDLTVDKYKNFATDSVISHNTPEIAAALNIYADETAASDDRGRSLHVFSENSDIKKTLDELFYDILNVEFNLRPWVRNLVKFGDFFLYNEVLPEHGVINVTPIPVDQVERVEGYDPEDPYAVRFKWLTHGGKILENWQVTHFRILGNDRFLPYGSCHAKGTKVLCKDGVKEIQNIIPGDKVVSLDVKTGKKVISNVLGVKASGTKDVFEIRTKHNQLRTSAEHRILTVDKQTGEKVYKSTTELKVGDLLFLSKRHNVGHTVKIDKTAPTGKNFNGYWNTINNIPDVVTPEFSRLFGFLIGAGWLCRRTNQVAFSNGTDEQKNLFYRQLLEKFSGNSCRVNYNKPHCGYEDKTGQTVVSSKMLKIIIQRLGFEGYAKTKRIPSWVFSATKEVKEAFVRGLYDADGSSFVDRWGHERFQIELSNKELVEDFKALIQSLGYKTGKIGKRDRRNKQLENNSKIQSSCPSWYLYWFQIENQQTKKHRVYANAVDIVTEPIISIESSGNDETFDIHVDNEDHNFFANGICTHNSILDPARRVWHQLGMLEDAMLVYRIVRSPERRVFYVDVANIHPNDIPSYMEAVKSQLTSKNLVEKTTGREDRRWNPVSVLEDFWVPKRGANEATKIETLPGGTNSTAIEDVEYIQKKLFAALQIPKAYLGFDEALGGKATLAQEDIRFSRTISILQKMVIAELNKLAMLHLYARGFDGEDLVNFEIKLSNPSSIAVQQKLDLWKNRFEIGGAAKETKLVDENWIKKNLLGLTSQEIADIEIGLRRDKISEAEIETITIENLPAQQQRDVDPFDPSNYSQISVEHEPSKQVVNQLSSQKEIDYLASQNPTLGKQDGDIAPLLGGGDREQLPIGASPTPILDKQRRNSSRRVDSLGNNKVDFAKILSTRNRDAKDPFDYEYLRNPLRKEGLTIKDLIDRDIESELRSILKPTATIPKDMKSIFDHFDRHYQVTQFLKEENEGIDFSIVDEESDEVEQLLENIDFEQDETEEVDELEQKIKEELQK